MMNIYRLLDRVMRLSDQDVYGSPHQPARMEQLAQTEEDKELTKAVSTTHLRYLEALEDDFNTAGALAFLFELCNDINRYIDQHQTEIKAKDESKEFILQSARMITSLGQILGLLEGTITEIGITYLRLDTADGPMSLPNAQVLAAAVSHPAQPSGTTAQPGVNGQHAAPAAPGDAPAPGAAAADGQQAGPAVVGLADSSQAGPAEKHQMAPG